MGRMDHYGPCWWRPMQARCATASSVSTAPRHPLLLCPIISLFQRATYRRASRTAWTWYIRMLEAQNVLLLQFKPPAHTHTQGLETRDAFTCGLARVYMLMVSAMTSTTPGAARSEEQHQHEMIPLVQGTNWVRRAAPSSVQSPTAWCGKLRAAATRRACAL